ncbi:MAG: hypothetical protein QM800_01000 [Paludibacter sp.]
MIKSLQLLIPFLLFLVSACNQVSNELQLAEQLLETAPDSILHILNKINPGNFESPSHRALYGLLYFEALDKKDKPLKPD